MKKCKNCRHFVSLDDKKPLAWGDCHFFDNKREEKYPIWTDRIVKELYRLGYVSPNQESCKTFERK